MLRTQIYLPADLRQAIDVVAKKEKKPAAQVIRELLKTGINNRQQESLGHALSRLSALGAQTDLDARGPSDLSNNIDTYLYDELD